MTRFRRILVVAAAVSACAPGLAAAQSDPEDVAAAACKAERTAVGEATFKQTYGTNKNKSNAFGKCVSKRTNGVEEARENAAKACKAERAANPTAFANKWGTNRNKSNAFGKCVSATAKEFVDDQTDANVNAAKRCRTERNANPSAFKQKYGTNENKSNAFGKCVSKLAKDQS